MAKKTHAQAPSSEKEGTKNYRAVAEHLIFMAMRIALLCVIGVFFYLGMNKAYILGYHVFSAYPATSEKEKTLTEDVIIIEGQSAFKIGESLEKDGIIIDGIAFGIQSMLYELEPIPGTYTVSSDMSAKEILKLLSSEKNEEESTTP